MKRADYSAARWGQMSDRRIAIALGTTRKNVQKYRLQHGIEPWSSTHCHPRIRLVNAATSAQLADARRQRKGPRRARMLAVLDYANARWARAQSDFAGQWWRSVVHRLEAALSASSRRAVIDHLATGRHDDVSDVEVALYPSATTPDTITTALLIEEGLPTWPSFPDDSTTSASTVDALTGSPRLVASTTSASRFQCSASPSRK